MGRFARPKRSGYPICKKYFPKTKHKTFNNPHTRRRHSKATKPINFHNHIPPGRIIATMTSKCHLRFDVLTCFMAFLRHRPSFDNALINAVNVPTDMRNVPEYVWFIGIVGDMQGAIGALDDCLSISTGINPKMSLVRTMIIYAHTGPMSHGVFASVIETLDSIEYAWDTHQRGDCCGAHISSMYAYAMFLLMTSISWRTKRELRRAYQQCGNDFRRNLMQHWHNPAAIKLAITRHYRRNRMFRIYNSLSTTTANPLAIEMATMVYLASGNKTVRVDSLGNVQFKDRVALCTQTTIVIPSITTSSPMQAARAFVAHQTSDPTLFVR